MTPAQILCIGSDWLQICLAKFHKKMPWFLSIHTFQEKHPAFWQISNKAILIDKKFVKIKDSWLVFRENNLRPARLLLKMDIFLPIDVENHSGFRWFISQVGYGISYVIPFILKGFLTISGLLLICFLFWGKFQTYWQFICATVLFFLFILISDNFWYGFLIGMVQCCVTYTVSEVIEDMKQPLFFRSRV